jgi:hypothetical protein
MVKLHIYDNGDHHWYLNELWHRANGPAIRWNGGILYWCWQGQPVTEFEHMMLSAQEQVDG